MESTTLASGRAVAPLSFERLASVLVFAVIVALPFQRSPLSDLGFGSFGQSLAVIPATAFLGLMLLRAVTRPASVSMSPTVLFAIAYVCATTVFGLIQFEWAYRGASLLVKALFASVHWIFLLVGVAIGLMCRREVLRPGVLIAFVIHAVSFFLVRRTGLEETQIVGFSSEASHYGVATVCLGALGAYLSKSSWERRVYIVVTLVLVIIGRSKGALACLGMAAVIVALFRPPADRGQRFILYGGVFCFAAALLLAAAVSIRLDLREFTSVATRSSGAITALRIGLMYPFGVGLGGFFPAFAETIPSAWNLISSLVGTSLNLGEAFAFAYTDDRNISAKTFFFDALIYFGWPGMIALIAFMARLCLQWLRLRSPDAHWLATGLVFAFLAMSTYYTVIPFYVVPLMVGFALREIRKV